jgi:hypothetical protein
MTGKGAPKGNTYASKEDRGRTISLYLSAVDMAFLRRLLSERDEPHTDADCVKAAKRFAKNGVYREIKSVMDAEIL